MKFKNGSNKVKFVKNKSVKGQDPEWDSVEPGKEVELPVDAHLRDSEWEPVLELEPEKELPKEVKESELVLVGATFKSEKELKKMTNDALNDYAASLGFKKAKSSWKKDRLVKEILKYQNAL